VLSDVVSSVFVSYFLLFYRARRGTPGRGPRNPGVPRNPGWKNTGVRVTCEFHSYERSLCRSCFYPAGM